MVRYFILSAVLLALVIGVAISAGEGSLSSNLAPISALAIVAAFLVRGLHRSLRGLGAETRDLQSVFGMSWPVLGLMSTCWIAIAALLSFMVYQRAAFNVIRTQLDLPVSLLLAAMAVWAVLALLVVLRRLLGALAYFR